MQSNFPKVPFFLSISFFLLCLFSFLFLYQQVNNKNSLIEQAQSSWQTEAMRRNKIKSLDNSIKIIATEKQQFETHFAQSSDIVPFLDTVEKLAQPVGAQAQITSVDILPGNTGLSVGMKASGSFESVYKFLRLLENSPYELSFMSVNIQNGSLSDTSGKTSTPKTWEAIFKIKLLSFTP